MKVFLGSYLIVYLLACFVLPTVQVWKKTGLNPLVFGSSDNVYDFIGRSMKALIAIAAIPIILFIFLAQLYFVTGPIVFLQVPILEQVGGGILVVSLVWTIISQQQMRNSWRIGIDHQNRTELVARGLFKLSRNPIFLGMILALLGLFLILPNAVLLAVLVTGYCLIQVQVRLEEEFLTKTHGEPYIQYKKRVRRWI